MSRFGGTSGGSTWGSAFGSGIIPVTPGSSAITQDDDFGLSPNPILAMMQVSNRAHMPITGRASGVPFYPELAATDEEKIEMARLAELPRPEEMPYTALLGSEEPPRPLTSAEYSLGRQQQIQAGGAVQFDDPGKITRLIDDPGVQFGLSALEKGGRAIDVPAGIVRDFVDIGLQRVRREQGAARAGEPGSYGSAQDYFSTLGGELLDIASRTGGRVVTLGGNYSIPGVVNKDDVRFESYIDVANRFVYGTENPLTAGAFDEIPQSSLMRRGIITGGLVADVVIDPLWGLGKMMSLGTKGEQLLKLNRIFDSIGLQNTQNRTMARLLEAQLETGTKLLDEGSELFKMGSLLEAERGTLALGTAAEQAAEGLRGVGSTLRAVSYDALPVRTMWSRMSGGRVTTEWVPVGGKALVKPLQALEKIGVSDAWTFMDAFLPSQMTMRLARGTTVDRGVSFGGQFYPGVNIDTLLKPRSQAGKFRVTGARQAAADIRRAILESQEYSAGKIKGAQYTANTRAIEIEGEIDSLSRMIAIQEGRELGIPTVAGTKQYEDLVTNVRREMEVVLNDYAETVSVRGDEIEQWLGRRGIEGSVDPELGTYRPGAGIDLETQPGMEQDWAYNAYTRQEHPGTATPFEPRPQALPLESGIRMDPVMSPTSRKEIVRKAEGPLDLTSTKPWDIDQQDFYARDFDPLDLPIPEKFEHIGVREMVKDIRSWQKGYLESELAAGLRVAELSGEDPIQFMSKQGIKRGYKAGSQELSDYISEQASAYLYHRVTPETWEWMRSLPEPWVRQSAHTSTGWATTKKFLDPWSQTLSRRKESGTIEGFNTYMREKYGIKNFFEPNPALREPARWLEGQRRIWSAKYFQNMSERLQQHPQFFMPETGAPPPGWSRLGDPAGGFMSKRAWDALDDSTQSMISNIILPDSAKPMVVRQAELLQRPDYMNKYFRALQMTTNWWKSNTLAIWPGYHLGNFLSNFHLMWLGGMHDPLMFPLANKVRAGGQGVVKSAVTGVEYSFEQLRKLVAEGGVDIGFVRGNIEHSVQTSYGNKTSRRLMDGYYNERSIGEFLSGTLAMSTGVELRGFTRENWPEWASMILPGGDKWLPNRIGFMVGGNIEETARTAFFLNEIVNNGLDPAMAAKRTKQVLFDYTKREGSKQVASTLIPFYEFTAQNTMFQIMQATQTPGRTALTYRTLLQTLPSIQGDIDPGSIPEYRRGHALVKLNSDLAIDITRFLPTSETPAVLSDPMSSISTSPLFETGLGMIINLDLFTRRPIRQDEEALWNSEYYEMAGGTFPIPIWENADFALKNLSRMYSELRRGDLLRTAGINLVEMNPDQVAYFRVGDLERNNQTQRRIMDPSRTPVEATANKAREKHIVQSAELVSLYYQQFNSGKDGEGNDIPAYTKTAGVRDRYDILEEANTEILRIIDLVTASTTLSEVEKKEQASGWWSAWIENEAHRVDYLVSMANTVPQRTDNWSSTEHPGWDEMNMYYRRALSEIITAADNPNIGPFTYSYFRDQYHRVLEIMYNNRVVPESYLPGGRNYGKGIDWRNGRWSDFLEDHADQESLLKSINEAGTN